MKMVRFTKSMAPYVAGEERAVPDDVAQRLVTEGAAEIVPSVFDKQVVAEESKKRRSYLTRGKP